MNFSALRSNANRRKRGIVKAFACGALLALPSCKLPVLRPSEQAPPLPSSYNGATSSDNSAQLTIEEFYNDPVLTGLIDQALVGNRELKALNEEVEIAANEVLARRGAYFPFVSLNSGVGLDKHSLYTPLGAVEKRLEYNPGKKFPDVPGDFLGRLNIFWSVDIWRELRNARDAAIQRYAGESERRNFFVTRMVAEIAENYYTLMALDKRLEILDKNIELQQQSQKIAETKLIAGRGTDLAVKRFQAEVRKSQSEKLIVRQEIVEAENRINFLIGRFPVAVERTSDGFLDLNIHALSVGLPAQLLQNRPDIRQAERELEAAGLDVLVARAHFFPKLDINAGYGYQAFNPKYLFNTPDAIVANVAGDLTAPLINKTAIKAEYQSANAKQLESVYNYQRIVLNAFTEVVNRVTMAENYRKSIEIKKQQLEALEASVESANKLFNNARIEYVEVLLAQRDLLEARTVLIETKSKQLGAIVNAYQALGGGDLINQRGGRLGAGGNPITPWNCE